MTHPTAPSHPAHCYDWITPEDAIRHALAAFYTACRYTDHAHRAYPDDPNLTRESWAEHFADIFNLRVQLQAGTAGIEIHENTAEYLSGYTEPAWPVNILPPRDTGLDIHCRVSQNENAG